MKCSNGRGRNEQKKGCNRQAEDGYRYCLICREKDKARYYKRKDKVAVKSAIRRLAIKLEVLAVYGNSKCVCCGESDYHFLTIDHSFKDGKQHRQELLGDTDGKAGGERFYRKLKELGWPTDVALQVLCYSCHMAKDHYGQCPHNKNLLSREYYET